MFEPIFTGAVVAISLLVKSAPNWLPAISDTLIFPARDAFVGKLVEKGFDKGLEGGGKLLHRDEKEQKRYEEEQKHHLESALKNAAERGLTSFQTIEEQKQYSDVLANLSETDSHSEILRREALLLFTLETPDVAKLNKLYNEALCARSQSQVVEEVDAVPYLSSFFKALIAELYANPFFRKQMSDAIKARAALIVEQSFPETVTTLHQIRDAVVHDYTQEQFERDLQKYLSYLRTAFQYLKIAGIVPKDKIADPELNGIFVHLRITMQDKTLPEEKRQGSIVSLLTDHPHLVLLGGPGSGKSTVTRHLAWNHALANISASTTSNTPLIPGNPLPLRIELRRLIEARRHRNYDFLSYTTEVLLGREGIEINLQMFKDLLEQGKMLVLFDGLDEVATLDERRELVEEIERFAQRYLGNHILVTSRPVGYDIARFSDQRFSHAEVQEFNDHQIWQFLERWYIYVLRLSPIPHTDQQELDALFTTLKDNPRLHKLAENPLLLTVITALHRYERLPDKRVLVYDSCANLLLDTWARLKGTDERWKDMKMIKEDQSACVAHLGYVLHERSQESKSDSAGQEQDSSVNTVASDVSERFMRREIERFLQSRKLITEVAEQRAEADLFLKLIQVEAGLIVDRGTDEYGESLYGFVHRTFQEYFAAADLHERFQQAVDLTIIRDFLKERLHDPHWHEVILLLLGKLKSRPATIQLRQILESKLKSRRSQYTEIVQQDLFLVCNCLNEEIVVENELAQLVVSSLSKVAKGSPFPSQRDEALEQLGLLTQTRQYASLAQRELIDLLLDERISDVDTKLQAAQTLYSNSPIDSKEQQQSIQVLLDLAQRADLSFEQQLQLAEALFECDSPSEQRRHAVQRLLGLAQRSDLSVEMQIEVAELLEWWCSYVPFEKGQQQAVQLLSHLAQRSDLSVEEQVKVAEALRSSGRQLSLQQAVQLLSHLAQRSDLSVEEQVKVANALVKHSSGEEELQHRAIQWLWQLVQHPDLSIERQMDIAKALYRYSSPLSEERKRAFQILTSEVSNEQLGLVAKAFSDILYDFREEREKITQLFFHLAQRSGLSIEEQVQAAKILILYSLPSSEEEQQAVQILSRLVRHPGISIEQQAEAAQLLYRCSSHSSPEEGLAIELLSQLVQHPEVSFKQQLKIIETLKQYSPRFSSEEELAIELLSHLVQRSDLSVEQQIEVAQALYYSFDSEAEQQAVQLLLRLTQLPDLSFKEQVLVAEALYWHRLPSSEQQQKAIQLLLQLAQFPVLSFRQKMNITDILSQYPPYKIPRTIQAFLRPISIADVSIEQQILIPRTSYQYHLVSLKERWQLVHRLLELIRLPNLPIQEQVQVAEALYKWSSSSSEKARQQQANQKLLLLSERPDLSVEQYVQVAEALYRCCPSSEEGKQQQQQVVELLLRLAQRPDLAFEQNLLVIVSLYRSSSSVSKEEQQAAQMLLSLAQTPTLNLDKRLQAIAKILATAKENYSDRMQALQTLFTLLKGETLRDFLEEHWQITDNKKADSSYIKLIFELATNAALPTKVRDEMYQLLSQMVSEFDSLGVDA